MSDVHEKLRQCFMEILKEQCVRVEDVVVLWNDVSTHQDPHAAEIFRLEVRTSKK